MLVLVGIATPALGRWLQPYLAEAVFLLLTLSFLRLDGAALGRHLRRPRLILAATAWTGLCIPVLFGLLANLAGLSRFSPGLFIGVMLQGLASPLMGGPALAGLMGLDATLVLVTLVTGTTLLPFVAPVLGKLFFAGALTVSPTLLGVRLGATLLGSFLTAILVRRLAGVGRIERYRDAINGLNVLVLLVFVSAVMTDVQAAALAQPLIVAGLTALAFATALAVFLATAWVFRVAGRAEALSLGVMASQRNMGLMFAAIGTSLPNTAWLYFALCQFPIYLSPLLLPLLLRALDRKRRDGP